MTEGQSRQFLNDMLQDLGEYPVAEIEVAITAYRRDPKNRFFPPSGALRGLIAQARRERAQMEALPGKVNAQNRPIRWHDKPKCRWAAGWRETDVPDGELIRDILDGPVRKPRRLNDGGGSMPSRYPHPDLPPDAKLDSPAGVLPFPGTRQPEKAFESHGASKDSWREERKAA